MDCSYVYVMHAREFMKIGVTSSSLIKRANSVQTGCPLPITEILFFKFESRSMAFEAEKKLHSEFSEYRTHGEWFLDFKSFGRKMSRVLGQKISKIDFKSPIIDDTMVEIRNRRNETKLRQLKHRQQIDKENGIDIKVNELEKKDTSSMSIKDHVAHMKELARARKQAREYAIKRFKITKKVEK